MRTMFTMGNWARDGWGNVVPVERLPPEGPGRLVRTGWGNFTWEYPENPPRLPLQTRALFGSSRPRMSQALPNGTVPPNGSQAPPNGAPQVLPESKGGKTALSYQEAKELLHSLTIVLAPITAAEAAKEEAKEACLRELKAGPFPTVKRLYDRLLAFVNAGDEAATFQISHGEITVTQKAVDCAVGLGRAEALRTALTATGIGAGGTLLLLLL